MKRSEIIAAHYDAIISEMIDDYRNVVKYDGRIQYKLYIWDDGEFEWITGPQGDNSWLQPREAETRELFYITTICVDPSFNIWDYSENGEPDDDNEKDKMRDEIIDYLVDGYTDGVRDILDAIIDDAEYREKYDY